MDSNGIDHIFDNKSQFSKISTFGYSLVVTFANGSKTQSQWLGTTHSLPFFAYMFYVYVQASSFNFLSISWFTHSLDCMISLLDTRMLIVGSLLIGDPFLGIVY